MKIPDLILLLLLLFFSHCQQNKSISIIGQWRMHHMRHINGITERDMEVNEKLRKEEWITLCEYRSDSKYKYIRNTKAGNEPVVRGSFHLNQDIVFIHEMFVDYTRNILKLTSDSLILLTGDHITTWYPVGKH